MDTHAPHKPLLPSLRTSATSKVTPSRIFEAAAESNLHCFCLLQLIEVEPGQKDFVVLFANQKLAKLLQMDRDQILGSRLSKVYPFSDNWVQCDRYFQAYASGQAAMEEFPLQLFGETRWYRHEVVPIGENQLSITAEDITSRKSLQKQLVRKAYFDDLTGLKNRTSLMRYLERKSEQGAQCFLVLLDIDNFRSINQCYGSGTADLLIKKLSLALLSLEVGDCYRLNADVFALIVIRRDSEAALSDASISRWLQKLSGIYHLKAHRVACFLSAGYSVRSSTDQIEGSDFLSRVEIALAHAKSINPPKVTRYFGSIMEAHQQKLSIGGSLAEALRVQEFTAHYQPQYDLKRGCLVGCEALSRWHSRDLGHVSPELLLMLQSEMNLLAPLDLGLLKTVVVFCNQLPLFQDGICLSVNASPSSLLDSGYLDQLIALSKQLPSWVSLEVEITENALISDDQSLNHGMKRLLNADIGTALDDFGSGYSNLNYLSSYPFEKLKLDRSLLQNIETNPRNGLLISATIDLAHRLGIQVFAEGIESAYQYKWLVDAGCDLGQGYFLSRLLAEKDGLLLFESINVRMLDK